MENRNRLIELYAMAPTAPSTPLLVTCSGEKSRPGSGVCGELCSHSLYPILKKFELAPLANIDPNMCRFASKRGHQTSLWGQFWRAKRARNIILIGYGLGERSSPHSPDPKRRFSSEKVTKSGAEAPSRRARRGDSESPNETF